MGGPIARGTTAGYALLVRRQIIRKTDGSTNTWETMIPARALVDAERARESEQA